MSWDAWSLLFCGVAVDRFPQWSAAMKQSVKTHFNSAAMNLHHNLRSIDVSWPFCILTRLNGFLCFHFDLCVYLALSILFLHYLSLHQLSLFLSHLNGWQINPVPLVPFNQRALTHHARLSVKVNTVGRWEAKSFTHYDSFDKYRKSIMTMFLAVEMI